MKLCPKLKSWGGEPSIWVQCQLYLRIREGGGGGAGSASDLPPCCWLPLFAHSVNYYQKAVYLGCSPMLLHILWPIIKGDLHYKPWSPSKKATVSAWRPIPALQHYQEHSLLICVPVLLRVSPFFLFPPSALSSHSPNSLAQTCTCRLKCARQVPHPRTLLFIIPFMFAFISFGVVAAQKQGKK